MESKSSVARKQDKKKTIAKKWIWDSFDKHVELNPNTQACLFDNFRQITHHLIS